jgi:hypothetical protein
MVQPKQKSLFDPLDEIQKEAHSLRRKLFAGEPVSAQEAKQEAMERVVRHTPPEWSAAFRRAIERVAREHLRFNADPVWERFQEDYPDWKAAHPRAAGPVILRAVKDGVIVQVRNLFWNSNRRSCHGRSLAVYESLMFSPNATNLNMR